MVLMTLSITPTLQCSFSASRTIDTRPSETAHRRTMSSIVGIESPVISALVGIRSSLGSGGAFVVMEPRLIGGASNSSTGWGSFLSDPSGIRSD